MQRSEVLAAPRNLAALTAVREDEQQVRAPARQDYVTVSANLAGPPGSDPEDGADLSDDDWRCDDKDLEDCSPELAPHAAARPCPLADSMPWLPRVLRRQHVYPQSGAHGHPSNFSGVGTRRRGSPIY